MEYLYLYSKIVISYNYPLKSGFIRSYVIVEKFLGFSEVSLALCGKIHNLLVY